MQQLAAFTQNIISLEIIISFPVGFKMGSVWFAYDARSETNKMNARDVTLRQPAQTFLS